MSARPKWTDLLPDRHLLLTTLRGSRVHGKDALLTLIDRELQEAQRRAENARESAQKNAARLEQAIRMAVGTLPQRVERLTASQVLNRMARAGAEAWGLRKLPDIATVRRVLRKIKQENATVLA